MVEQVLLMYTLECEVSRYVNIVANKSTMDALSFFWGDPGSLPLDIMTTSSWSCHILQRTRSYNVFQTCQHLWYSPNEGFPRFLRPLYTRPCPPASSYSCMHEVSTWVVSFPDFRRSHGPEFRRSVHRSEDMTRQHRSSFRFVSFHFVSFLVLPTLNFSTCTDLCSCTGL